MKTSTSIHSNNRTIEQSNISHSHRGSALLIVLGMLSFMVVSAVGFSIYMRQGRLPSSYLRRNVASRYLVKAALANAIDELDGGFMSLYEIGANNSNNPEQGRFFGIYDDPYPGVGEQMNETNLQGGGRKYPMTNTKGNYTSQWFENGDYWFHRVFCPFGPLPEPNNETAALQKPFLTTPTLTLEALAYLPPAIIDDVRKVSRLTRTAQWRALPYEAGRFAYTAVNVSDLFDINRLQADVARNSGRDRISLGSLCTTSPDAPTTIEDANVTMLQGVLDELEQKKVNGNVTPFTSLADFNLVAAGKSAFGFAPFMDYIGKSSGTLLRNGDAQMANSIFITDTWFPQTNDASQVVFDLAGGHQPFVNYRKLQGFLQVGLDSTLNSKDQVGKMFSGNLGIGLVSLYDYLDSDNIPVSLALPTVEAVPMVVGVSAPVGLVPSFGPVGTPLPAQTIGGLAGTVSDLASGLSKPVNDISITRNCVQQGLKLTGSINLPIVVTSPFKRMKTTNRAKNYQLRGLVRVYLGPANMNCRLWDVEGLIHPLQADWQSPGGSVANGVATIVSSTIPLNNFNKDVKTTDDAVAQATLQFPSVTLELPLYWQVTEGGATSPSGNNAIPDPNNYKASYYSLGQMVNLPAALRPLTGRGEVEPAWKTAASGAFKVADKFPAGIAEFDPASFTAKYRLYASVWVQVLDGTTVVDMVPASRRDDIEWLSCTDMDTGSTQIGDNICGNGAPTLNFMQNVDFTYAAPDAAFNGQPFENSCDWKALYAFDPRFNYAPEDWFSMTSAGATKSEWMSLLGLSGSSSTILGRDGRDRDIFMFVSDQEYLQSVGELQFLLALRDFDGNAVFPEGDLPSINASLNPLPFSDATRRGVAALPNCAHHGYFWRTYSAYRHSATEDTFGINPFHLKKFGAGVSGEDAKIESGVGSFKLNPFSEDSRVISAAVVGTPFDYYVASTNDNQMQSGGQKNTLISSMDFKEMMDKYSFGKSDLAQISDDQLADVVDVIRDTFRGMTKFDMDEAWGKLAWQIYNGGDDQINDNNVKFMADDIVLSKPLHGVDRKHLYSFWRECFDNRQQLFLIFVRAEPTAIGGGAAGTLTSAQLGGRAVALVWRDPAVPTTGGTRPARTSLNNRQDFRDFKRDHAPHRTRVLFFHQFD